MKSWKTTLSGLFVGVPVAIDALMKAYVAGAFNSKSGLQLVCAIGVILLGLYAKDNNVTGGTVAQ